MSNKQLGIRPKRHYPVVSPSPQTFEHGARDLLERSFGYFLSHAAQRGGPWVSREGAGDPPIKYQESRYQGKPPNSIDLYVADRINNRSLGFHRRLLGEKGGTGVDDGLWSCILTESVPDDPLGTRRSTVLRVTAKGEFELCQYWDTEVNERGVPLRGFKIDHIESRPYRDEVYTNFVNALGVIAARAPVEQHVFMARHHIDPRPHEFMRNASPEGWRALGGHLPQYV